MEWNAAHLVFPMQGRCLAVAYTTSNTPATLYTNAKLIPAIGNSIEMGNVVMGMILTTNAQVIFDSSAATVDSDSPLFPAGIYYGLPPAGFVAIKASTSAGTAYFWLSS